MTCLITTLLTCMEMTWLSWRPGVATGNTAWNINLKVVFKYFVAVFTDLKKNLSNGVHRNFGAPVVVFLRNKHDDDDESMYARVLLKCFS